MSMTVRIVMNGRLRAAVKSAQGKALRASGFEIERSMKQVLSSPGGSNHTPSFPGMPPNRQHGELRSSVASALSSGGNSVLAGATAKYARIQEKGGTIRPRSAKALAVPISAISRGKRPRDFTDLIMIRRKGSGKAPLLVRKTVKGRAGMDLLFVLLKSVTLPPRPFVKLSLLNAIPNIKKCWKGMLRK